MYEKRTHFRRPLNVPVTCYVEGRRFDALAKDISRGGIFLEVTDPQAVPLSAVVGLTFQGNSQDQATFLFGRVARRQEGKVEGIGLCWDKVVSGGDPSALEAFVTKMFGINRPRISCESTTRGARAIFRFDSAELPLASAPQTTGGSSSPSTRAASQPSLPDSAKNQKQQKPPELPPPIPGGEMPRRKVSQLGDYDNVSCYIKGYIEENFLRYPALITRLGPRSALAHTPLKYDPRPMYADLIFSIPSKDGPVEVTCRSEARQIGPEEPGNVAFRFLEVDEGEKPGILRKYLSWLQIHEG